MCKVKFKNNKENAKSELILFIKFDFFALNINFFKKNEFILQVQEF
jgi:hypothetical protein